MAALKGPFYQELGGRVAVARRLAGLNQEAVARAVGLSRTSITNIEKGRQPVDVHVLLRLAEVLNTTVESLLPQPEHQVVTKMDAELDRLDPRQRALVDRFRGTGAQERRA